MRYCESTDKEEQCRFCEKESVTVSMGNLLTFPFVSEAVDKGRVALHGWCAWIAGDDALLACQGGRCAVRSRVGGVLRTGITT